MTEEEIKVLLTILGVEKFYIHDDLTVDADCDIFFSELPKNLPIFSGKLPVKFNKVAGYLRITNCNLISLIGCPEYVGDYFNCMSNLLTTLEGCPNYINDTFYCSQNRLTTLNGLPINFHIGGDFYCLGNNITDPKEFSKLFFGYIGGDIYIGRGKLDEFLNEHKNPPKKDLPRLLSELRKITL